jgi:hypothetical protein
MKGQLAELKQIVVFSVADPDPVGSGIGTRSRRFRKSDPDPVKNLPDP